MASEDIEIRTDSDLGRPYRELGPIKARVTAKTILSKERTIEEVNAKLRVAAAKAGADAVINVAYQRGVSFTSWKALTAAGTAVTVEQAGPPG